jgi:hypothetical protein
MRNSKTGIRAAHDVWTASQRAARYHNQHVGKNLFFDVFVGINTKNFKETT